MTHLILRSGGAKEGRAAVHITVENLANVPIAKSLPIH